MQFLNLLIQKPRLLSIQKLQSKSKITNITNLATKVALNRKATEIKSKIPDINNLAAKAAEIEKNT